MTLLFLMAEYSAALLLAFIILVGIAVAIEGTPLAPVFAIFAFLCFVGAMTGAWVSDEVDYLAYRYDKIVAEHGRIVEECPDMNTAQCIVRLREYQVDSVGIWFKYRNALQRFE